MDYKKILEGVVNIINTAEKSDIGFTNICTYIGENCPELLESEDEKVRKFIIEQLFKIRDTIVYNSNLDRELANAIDWLEKLKVFAEHGDGLYYFGNSEFTYVDNPTWDNVHKPFDYENASIVQKDFAPKEEPRFNIGDWIVSDLEDVNEDFRLCKIIGIEDGCYKIQSANGCIGYNLFEIWESDYYLWSIEDAKDGDVLVHNECTFIFMGIKDGVVKAFEKNLLDGTNPVNFGEPDKDKDYCPATKEQRDILMKAMADAGWEFDFEKKELKKIVTPIFKVGDTIIKKHNSDIRDFGSFTITDITGGKYWYNDRIICDITKQDEWELYEQVETESKGEQKPFDKAKTKFHEGDWVVVSTIKGDRIVQIASVEHLKDGCPSYITTEGSSFGNRTKARLLTDKDVKTITIPESKVFVNQKPAWSEEDELNLKQAIYVCHQNGYAAVENWLKSLMPQINVTDKELAQARKEAYNEVLDKIEYHDDWPTFDDGWDAAIWYLKKRNTMPQNQWKPSEEQMRALDSMLDEYDGLEFDLLVSLENDLKKL